MKFAKTIVTFASAIALANGMELMRGQTNIAEKSKFRFEQLHASVKNPDVLSLLMALMGLLNPLTGGPPKPEAQKKSTLGPGGPGMSYPPLNKNVQEYLDKAVEEAKTKAIAQMTEFNADKDLGNDLVRVAEERLKKYWFIGQCRRNYSRTCPLEWVESEEGNGMCEPPMTYQGPCRAANMQNSSPFQKEDFAWRCEVQWPCFAAPARNYNVPCPSLWINVGSNLCIAPDHYSGGCSPAMDFRSFSQEEKSRWESECFAQWPAISTEKEKKVKTERPLKAARRSEGGPVSEDGKVRKI